MSNQVPSVGRIVHYRSYGTPGGEYQSLPRAAVITAVNADGTVGLCILNPTGMFFNEAVAFGPNPGQWSWPPYVAPQGFTPPTRPAEPVTHLCSYLGGQTDCNKSTAGLKTTNKRQEANCEDCLK